MGDASDYFLKNKDWVAKKNLTKPIKLLIDGKQVDLDKNTDQIMQYFYKKTPDFLFLPKYDKVSKQKIKCAKQLKHNLYDIKGDGNFIELPLDINWSVDPLNDRNWQYEFHSLKFIRCFMNGYNEFKDPWYLYQMKFVLTDWLQDNFKPDFPSKEFSWYNHTIPNRLHVFMRIFEFIRRNKALDDSFTQTALRAIYWHARILAEEKPLYMKNHNHGLAQSYALFQASQLFSEFQLSVQWEKIARERLKNEITFALTKEGVHKENSPGYHDWVAPYCAEINQFAKHYTGKSITKNVKKLKNSGLKFITAITRPDGTLPIIGDTIEGKPTKPGYTDIETLSYYPYFQYVHSRGKDGHKPQQTIFQFPESGYYIYRDKWDKVEENTATQLILKCGFLAIGHRHNDDGNILLYGLGEDWLIDTGIYGYKYDKYRKYATSASAHNISFPYAFKEKYLSDSYLMKELEKRFSVYKNDWGIIESDENHAICKSHMFDGFTYTRKLKITGERTFALRDSLIQENNESQKKQVFMTTFRVPDDKEVYINPEKKIIMVSNTLTSAGLEIHYNKNFKNINLYRGEYGEITSLKTSKWQNMKPVKTITFVDYNKSYAADYELKLVKYPSLKGFYGLPINNNILDEYETRILIQDHDKDIIFSVKSKLKNVKVAFYLYKDNKKIGSRGYSKNFSYKLDKQKYGAGKYRVFYFIIDEKEIYPGKAKKIESGFSKYVTVQ